MADMFTGKIEGLNGRLGPCMMVICREHDSWIKRILEVAAEGSSLI